MCLLLLFLLLPLSWCHETLSPTPYPTQSPVVDQGLRQVMYRIEEGTLANSLRTIGNVSFQTTTGADVNAPKNMTLQLLGGARAVPVKWTSVTYRLFHPENFTTSTQFVAECNPVANPVQGSLPVEEDGLRVCPTIYKCILTQNCTDDLSPNGLYKQWPDLRACVCSRTVTTRQDIPALTGLLEDVQMVDVKAKPTTPSTAGTSVLNLAIIKCNSFIERELNCQFPLLLASYVEQCQEEPIKCYSNTLGYAFGGFWNQNPLFQYNIPRSNWTERHYLGVASVLNYELYTDMRGLFVDPATSGIWTHYMWVNLSSFNVSSREVAPELAVSTADIIQLQEFNWLSGQVPSPPTTTEMDITQLVQALFCIFEGSLSGDITQCNGFEWEQAASLLYRYPAYTQLIPVYENEFICSLEMTPTYNFTSIEVLNANGQSCGKFYQPTQGQTIEFVCLNTENNTATQGLLRVLYHGVMPLFDVAGSTISDEVPLYTDPLAPYLDTYPYNLSAFVNLLYGAIAFNSQIGPSPHASSFLTFPQRRSSASQATFQLPTITLNYSSVTTLADVRQAWDGVTSAILENNTYPWNVPLYERVLERGYGRVAVNLSDPTHLQFLHDFWSTQLAPRQCSEGWQCQTFSLGKCIFPSEGPRQYWWNGQPSQPGYEIPGGASEGGCRCHQDFQRGFYQLALFCSRCEEGYGPQSLDEWGRIQQSAQLYAPTYPQTYPFTLENPTPAQFESQLACRFPTGKDPIPASLADFNLCGGHGQVQWNTTEERTQVDTFAQGRWLRTPTCTGILLDGVLYTYKHSTSPLALQYTNGTSLFYVIDSVPWLDGQMCLLSLSQTQPPFYGSLVCGDTTHTIGCVNDALYRTQNVHVQGVRIEMYDTWTLHII